ncbi:MAG: tRNA (adenosine(37)-N6)-threonylcarbamoyltransferase complex ATPase subunit type 1 TsaE [Ignavibacteria bacterium]
MIVSKSEKETIAAGRKFADELKRGSLVGLKGNLGTGKTQFVKGICNYFKVQDIVNSPTFILVNEYKGIDKDNNEIKIYHLDLYRLKSPAELEVIGFNEYIDTNSIVLIEWPEIAEEYLNKEIDKVLIEYGSKTEERLINFIKTDKKHE